MNTYGRQDIYERVTNIVLEQLEKGTITWRKGWKDTGRPANYITKKQYNGFNAFLLSSLGYSSPYFLTFNQCQQQGGKIKAGAKSVPIVYFDFIPSKWEKVTTKDKTTGEEITKPKMVAMLKYYNVFNITQTTLPVPKTEGVKDTFNPIQEAEKIVQGYKTIPKLTHEGSRAYYSPLVDVVNMPDKMSFESESNYYSVLFHELTHSTGAQKRLNRSTVTDGHRFGSHEYSKEELIAEMGASFMASIAGIEQATLSNSVAYIQGWLKALRNDKKMLVMAGAQAQKAVNYITNYQVA